MVRGSIAIRRSAPVVALLVSAVVPAVAQASPSQASSTAGASKIATPAPTPAVESSQGNSITSVRQVPLSYPRRAGGGERVGPGPRRIPSRTPTVVNTRVRAASVGRNLPLTGFDVGLLALLGAGCLLMGLLLRAVSRSPVPAIQASWTAAGWTSAPPTGTSRTSSRAAARIRFRS